MKHLFTIFILFLGIVALYPTNSLATPLGGGTTTILISRDSNGIQFPSASWGVSMDANGQFVTFRAGSTELPVVILDRETGEVQPISYDWNGVLGHGLGAVISADGRYVAFETIVSLLEEDIDSVDDVYLYDQDTNELTLISVPTRGSGGGNMWAGHPSISDNGRYIAFEVYMGGTNPSVCSSYSNKIYLHDTQTGKTTCVSVDSNGIPLSGVSRSAGISGNGQYVAFDHEGQIYIHNMQTEETTLVSQAPDGTPGNGRTANLSRPSLSYDGRFVAFDSSSSNLVSNDVGMDLDIFVRDRITEETFRLSVSPTGQEGAGNSYHPTISRNGRYVAFGSTATNLVTNDQNQKSDVFLHDRLIGLTQRVSVGANNQESNGDSLQPSSTFAVFPAITDNGRYVAFDSEATNLVSNDLNNQYDVFLRDTGEPLPTVTPTVPATNTPAVANTPTGLPTSTPTTTYTATATSIATNTSTPTMTVTNSPTPTFTATATVVHFSTLYLPVITR